MTTIVIHSPIGPLQLSATETALTEIDHVSAPPSAPTEHPVLRSTVAQLEEYFCGQRTTFDLPLAPEGTDFQKSVWNALLTIPYGQTRSYTDIAEQIKNPKAVRAVGLANGRNPLSIVIPCHRVIGKNRTLTGYAGGLERKRILLAVEGSELAL